jgi:tetratricopeptide (TPR) repeat protein
MAASYAATRASLIKEPLRLEKEALVAANRKACELRDVGKFDEALAFLQAQSAEDTIGKVMLGLMAGDVHESKLDDRTAMESFLAAKTEADRLMCVGDTCSRELEAVIAVLGRIAGCFFARGDFDKAAAYFKKAKALLGRVRSDESEAEEKDGGWYPKAVRVASLDCNIAACIAAEQPTIQCDEAIKQFSAALQVVAEHLGTEHVRTGVIEYNLQKEQNKSMPE